WIVLRSRRWRLRSWKSGITKLLFHGDDRPVPVLDRDFRQRTRRRTGDHLARVGIEATVMAGAYQLVLILGPIDLAGKVRADPAVGNVSLLIQPEQDTEVPLVVGIRIVEVV